MPHFFAIHYIGLIVAIAMGVSLSGARLVTAAPATEEAEADQLSSLTPHVSENEPLAQSVIDEISEQLRGKDPQTLALSVKRIDQLLDTNAHAAAHALAADWGRLLWAS